MGKVLASFNAYEIGRNSGENITTCKCGNINAE